MSEELTLDGFDLGAALGIEPEPKNETTPAAPQGSIKVSHRMGARQRSEEHTSELQSQR